MSANDPKRTLCSKHSWPCLAVDVRLLVQNHIQQRTMDFYAAVVIDKTQFSKFVHESTDARSRRADHLCECLLADFRQDRFGFAFLPKIREKQEGPAKRFSLELNSWSTKSASTRIVRAKRCETNISESGLLMEDADHSRLLQPHDLAFRHCRCGR